MSDSNNPEVVPDAYSICQRLKSALGGPSSTVAGEAQQASVRIADAYIVLTVVEPDGQLEVELTRAGRTELAYFADAAGAVAATLAKLEQHNTSSGGVGEVGVEPT